MELDKSEFIILLLVTSQNISFFIYTIRVTVTTQEDVPRISWFYYGSAFEVFQHAKMNFIS
jgi:hypothetical protein